MVIMKRKRKYSKHFDACHKIMFNAFPDEYTKLIGVPGHFVKKVKRVVHLKDGTGGEMDSAYIANPDYEILFEKAAVCLEHQSKSIGDEKIVKIGDYDIQLVVNEHLPTLMVVASHIPPENQKNKLIRTPSDKTELYFVDLTEENIMERLNNVKTIINNNKHLSRKDALNLGIVMNYAPRKNAIEITREITNIYIKTVDDLDFETQSILYDVIIILIDAYIDDENEYQRLIKMINNRTSKEIIENFNPFVGLEESLEYANTRISNLEDKNSTLENRNSTLENRNSTLENRNSTLENRNSTLENRNSTLENRNSTLENRNSTLEAEKSALKERNTNLESENYDLKIEVEKLKNKLNGN